MTTNENISDHPRWTEPLTGIRRDSDGRIIPEANQTAEQINSLEIRVAAFRHYYQTGDDQPLIDLGIFPERPEDSQ